MRHALRHGWVTHWSVCDWCQHRHVSVHPVPLEAFCQGLECPNCGHLTARPDEDVWCECSEEELR